MTCLTGYQQASSSDSEHVSTSAAVVTGNLAGLATCLVSGTNHGFVNLLEVENVFWVENLLGFELK